MTNTQSSLAQVGQWLAHEVGAGTIFTKQQLRSALPQFEQADRRMRDLRAYGWRIDTNRQDARLRPHELRLVTVGSEVWSASFRPNTVSRVSNKERLTAISEADFRCQTCGIQVGQQRLPGPEFARLEVTASSSGLLVACDLCSKGTVEIIEAGLDRLKRIVEALSDADATLFWERAEARLFQSPLEAALALASRLPLGEVLEAKVFLTAAQQTD